MVTERSRLGRRQIESKQIRGSVECNDAESDAITRTMKQADGLEQLGVMV
jgi:hypothetical protein